jgi:hypothetical protein
MVPILSDEEVYAGGVLFVAMAVRGRKVAENSFRDIAKLENALGLVVIQHPLAEDFGQFAGCVAAQAIHLPEAVLGGDIALGKEQIILCGSLNMRDAVAVAPDRYRG